ncbi:FliA/WhiG family RNA polymerase sigma factor [Symbiobacterium thermophilum]|uniref:FliA/WhiG family RNA polymerase sigma factor n=1 Tax=Symbiobacterium thermophilum TaxID=2734 RepID=UPI0023525332|nr:FliA/WhiG family RNA polymerase sigma factor [Symbiobacterium thermophilum]
MTVQYSELWRRWRQFHDTAARDALVQQYLWLVRYVAGRLMVGMPDHIDQGDVEGHGCFGLLEAVARYDPDRGVRFETFAIPWIRGACLEGLRAMQWAPALRRRVRQLEKVRDELVGILGREPSAAELADHMGITVDEAEKRLQEAGTLAVLSLDEALAFDDGESTALGDRVADDEAADPERESELAERREVLARAIASLSEQEQLVLALIYQEGLIAKEVSEVLGVSQARISQVHSKAILRLRGKLSRLKRDLVS